MSFRRFKKLSENDRTLIIEELKALLQAHEEIVFAILYGSLANPGHAEKYGDIDIAVYVSPQSIHRAEYVLESRIEAEIIKSFSHRRSNFPLPEVLIINKAPNHFLVGIFKGNYVVLKGEEGAITDFIEEIGEKSMDNFHFRMESLQEVVEG